MKYYLHIQYEDNRAIMNNKFYTKLKNKHSKFKELNSDFLIIFDFRKGKYKWPWLKSAN